MAKSKLNWLKKRKKTEPELPYESPLWLGPISNGEFFQPQSARDRKMRAEILRRCDENARKIGMDRREFIASAMGMATAFSVINMAAGCGGKDGLMTNNEAVDFVGGRSAPTPTPPGMMQMTPSGMMAVPPGTTPAMQPQPMLPNAPQTPAMTGAGSAPGMPGMPGAMAGTPKGGFVCSKASTMDESLASEIVGGDYFILDFQTHHTAEGMTGPVFDGCMGNQCTSPNTYIQKIFEMSDTTVAVLSGLPQMIGANGDLVGFSNDNMQASRDRVNKAAKAVPFGEYAERMVAHCQIMPIQSPGPNKELMMKAKAKDTRGWKCYPPTEGGWFLNEHEDFIQTAVDLKEPLVCVHKGFPFTGWSTVHANPIPDVGKVAKDFPGVNFVIYHSAFHSGHTEGAYDANCDPETGGTDRLAKVVSESGLTGMNVYAEMGSAWNIVMRDPMQAQHYLGKMMKYVGPNNMVWGSECVWFGTPQPQIEAMKAFKMDPDFAMTNGYQDYTDDIKRQVFGLNGAPLYRVDPCATRLKVSVSKVQMAKLQIEDEVGPRRWTLGQNRPVIASRRDFMQLWRWRKAHGVQA